MNTVISKVSRILKRFSFVGFTLLTAVAVAQAPANDVCTTIVKSALQAANSACASTGRNQVCYGNVLGEATPADGVSELHFNSVGDIAPVTQIKALHHSPLNEAANQWGVALMQLQANLPDTLPGQNVTFLMFGDVSIENAVEESAHISATAPNSINVRDHASMNAAVLGTVPQGELVDITGKHVNKAGEVWLRITFDSHRTRTGWVYGPLFSVSFDQIPDVAPGSLVMNPMQSFYFRSGIGRTTCAEAPDSGVIVQTPEGAGLVNFRINGVDVTLGSTALLSGSGGGFSVALLEGTGYVESDGVMRQLVPGSETSVHVAPPSGNAEPAPEIPSMPAPIAREKFAVVQDVLSIAPREVRVPEPARPGDIIRANRPSRGQGISPRFLEMECGARDDGAHCSCQQSATSPDCVPECDSDSLDPAIGCAPCVVGADGECCVDADEDGVCDATVDCSEAGLVLCDPTCQNLDGDVLCDAYDECVDANGDGVCDNANTVIPTSVPPTSTPIPPTLTPVPPTSTPVPPTVTPVPPTDTPLPPTLTPVPPTDTPLPPTFTPVPPTDTPTPTPDIPTATFTPSDTPEVLPPPPTSTETPTQTPTEGPAGPDATFTATPTPNE
jgi:hypothetical protein